MKWARLSHQKLYTTPFRWSLSHDRYRLPNGADADYYYLDLEGSTMVVPVLASGQLVLVSQHRYLMGRASLEFPAGGLEPGRDPLRNAQAELKEEAGYTAASWEKIGAFAPCNGLSNELCHVYVARDLEAGQACPEPTEELEVKQLTVDELHQATVSGELWDGMTLASLGLYERWVQR